MFKFAYLKLNILWHHAFTSQTINCLLSTTHAFLSRSRSQGPYILVEASYFIIFLKFFWLTFFKQSHYLGQFVLSVKKNLEWIVCPRRDVAS
jgi:hypothetical protein